MASAQRVRADFTNGGDVGDGRWRVYLRKRTLRQIERAGGVIADGAPVTLCDYDGHAGNPEWLVARGVLGYDQASRRWYMEYGHEDAWSEPRAVRDWRVWPRRSGS